MPKRIPLAIISLLVTLPVSARAADAANGTIALVLAPSVPALPRWGYLALAGALIVVGVVVMRRRTG
jgi:hypothetical protein